MLFLCWIKLELQRTSAIHLLSLHRRTLRLVAAVACSMSHGACYATLQSSLLSSSFGGHQPWSSRLGTGGRHLLLTPPLHPSSSWIWASDGQMALFQWALVVPFCLLRANKKSQTSDDCSLLASQTQNSSALPAFFCLYSWSKHYPPAQRKPSHDALSTSRDGLFSIAGCQSLLKTFVPEEVVLQIIAEIHSLTVSHIFISLKPLS